MKILQILAACVITNPIAFAKEFHWAFSKSEKPPVPEVADRSWPERPLDHFILTKLESAGLKPASKADRRSLIRRAYFDLIGLPPTPAQVESFVANSDPDAFENVVDELLSSPHYGERWGRHWLDIARYGDSNGGDENHPYPNAFRYRNYVIDAFNRDLPYDIFLREQLAGDLLPEPNFTATGFLAIGTKILAEKDPVKKRADIVDEQIDTFGRAIMAMTLGCARCHDHKFDPIPDEDYYALAGIFHSTAIGDTALLTADLKASNADTDAKVAALDKQIAAAEKELSDEGAIAWQAEEFSEGNVVVVNDGYGAGIGIISDPGSQDNFVEYQFKITRAATYFIRLRYAAANARPGRFLIDGDKHIIEPVLTKVTGGWNPEHQKWSQEGKVELAAGEHTLRIESKPNMSHIDRVQLLPGGAEIESLAKLEAERAKLVAERRKPEMVMAVRDGEIADTKLNIRGNPNDHGDQIPRGFLTKIGTEPGTIRKDRSGRLELANWLTQKDHPLTARVMVNRLWRWHFGRGIVTTMDNFGTKGASPSHPRLLDHLAQTFVENNWSIKAIHREIMRSSPYQMAAGIENQAAEKIDPDNQLYWRRDIRRLEAEEFRDAILAVSGSLDRTPHRSKPPPVKGQDPSPEDLANNAKTYEAFPHRSVYLPVIRSHVYDLFALLDFPDASNPVGDRATTIAPTQALAMLNNPFIIDQAAQLAGSARGKPIDELYLTLFARHASADEVEWAHEFLKKYTVRKDATAAWSALCQTLLISNEFLYLR